MCNLISVVKCTMFTQPSLYFTFTNALIIIIIIIIEIIIIIIEIIIIIIEIIIIIIEIIIIIIEIIIIIIEISNLMVSRKVKYCKCYGHHSYDTHDLMVMSIVDLPLLGCKFRYTVSTRKVHCASLLVGAKMPCRWRDEI